MATINIAKRNTTKLLDAGYKSLPRVLDFVIDFTKDVTMGTATDVIQLGTLPGGAVVLAVSVESVVPGATANTLLAKVGATTTNAVLTETDAAGAFAATVPAAIPLIVPAGGAELTLTGAIAARTEGVVRVICLVVEGDRDPRTPGIVGRDALA